MVLFAFYTWEFAYHGFLENTLRKKNFSVQAVWFMIHSAMDFTCLFFMMIVVRAKNQPAEYVDVN